MFNKIHPRQPEFSGHVVTNNKLCNVSSTTLTVWRKSLVFGCNGFTVFDSTGNIVFRVDNYPSDPKDEVVLMDAAGLALLTMRRKRLSLQREWRGFLGDLSEARKPLFVIRRASSLLIPTKTLAKVDMCSSPKRNQRKAHCNYRVEGCYAKRSFTLLNRFNEVVAEVKPKKVRSEITLGADVFNLTVSPGYDEAFVMGLIIVLDRNMPSCKIAQRFRGRPDKERRLFVFCCWPWKEETLTRMAS